MTWATPRTRREEEMNQRARSDEGQARASSQVVGVEQSPPKIQEAPCSAIEIPMSYRKSSALHLPPYVRRGRTPRAPLFKPTSPSNKSLNLF